MTTKSGSNRLPRPWPTAAAKWSGSRSPAARSARPAGLDTPYLGLTAEAEPVTRELGHVGAETALVARPLTESTARPGTPVGRRRRGRIAHLAHVHTVSSEDLVECVVNGLGEVLVDPMRDERLGPSQASRTETPSPPSRGISTSTNSNRRMRQSSSSAAGCNCERSISLCTTRPRISSICCSVHAPSSSSAS
jgi:hypothetical protein